MGLDGCQSVLDVKSCKIMHGQRRWVQWTATTGTTLHWRCLMRSQWRTRPGNYIGLKCGPHLRQRCCVRSKLDAAASDEMIASSRHDGDRSFDERIPRPNSASPTHRDRPPETTARLAHRIQGPTWEQMRIIYCQATQARLFLDGPNILKGRCGAGNFDNCSQSFRHGQ